jgi:hypothetical protein
MRKSLKLRNVRGRFCCTASSLILSQNIPFPSKVASGIHVTVSRDAQENIHLDYLIKFYFFRFTLLTK